RYVVGSDPTLMLDAPIPATREVLKRAQLTLDEINVIEINEAFASAVERIGTIQWLKSKNRSIETYLLYLSAQQEFRSLLLDTRNELEKLYQSSLSDEEKRVKKAEILDDLKQRYVQLKQKWPSNIHFDYWFKKPINNARLTATMTYLQKIPAFYTLFNEAHNNWQDFYNKVKTLEDLDKKQRDQLIQEKIQQAPKIEALAQLLN
ncbi:MAG: aminopeptidase, partial [Gammaproteobacteria bacterium]|nr:aminopeptidase [Gammaproteobacteria bacterium]